MVEPIIKALKQFKNRILFALFFMIMVSVVGIILLIIWEMETIYLILAIVAIVSVVITGTIFIYKQSKLLLQYEEDNLMPIIVRNADSFWTFSQEKFIKNDVMESLLIHKSGSFSASKTIVGEMHNHNFRLGTIYNIISSGNSSYPVFVGTYIEITLNKSFDGVFQIRDKQRPTKKECHKYLSKEDYNLFTTSDDLAKSVFSEDLLRLYSQCKKDYRKGFYFSIYNNKFIVGVNNNRNYFRFGLRRLNEERIAQRISDLRKISQLVNDICYFVSNTAIFN